MRVGEAEGDQKEMDAGHWRMDGSLDCGGWKTST